MNENGKKIMGLRNVKKIWNQYIRILFVICICALPVTACVPAGYSGKDDTGRAQTGSVPSSFSITDLPEYSGEP